MQIEIGKAALLDIQELSALASLYGLSDAEVLASYGVDTQTVKNYRAELPAAKTRPAQSDSAQARALLEAPSRRAHAFASQPDEFRFTQDRIVGQSSPRIHTTP